MFPYSRKIRVPQSLDHRIVSKEVVSQAKPSQNHAMYCIIVQAVQPHISSVEIFEVVQCSHIPGKCSPLGQNLVTTLEKYELVGEGAVK